MKISELKEPIKSWAEENVRLQPDYGENKDILFDEVESLVVRASCEERAREMANLNSACEGHIWDDKDLVNCEIVSFDGGYSGWVASVKA